MSKDRISKAEMLKIVGLSYPAVWKLAREDRFPRGIYIGTRVVWYLAEVEKWLAERPRQKFGTERDPIDRAAKVRAARAGHEARRQRAREAAEAAAEAVKAAEAEDAAAA